MKTFIISTFLLLAVAIQPANAYIDPGSGSAIVSAIIGFLVAIGLGIKTYWYKLKSFFKRKDDSEKKD